MTKSLITASAFTLFSLLLNSIALPADRGDIIDRNGEVIATGHREYPAAEATAHITGHCQHGNQLTGASGLEKAFDSSLSKGNPLQLNIDLNLQRATFEILRETGRPGAAVIIVPQSGAVLAMVSFPSYDSVLFASRADKDSDEQTAPPHSRACDFPYPPASTFKTFTSVALQKFGKSLSQTCTGITELDGRKYRCWKSSGHGDLPGVRQALCVSCNCYYYQAVTSDLSLQQLGDAAAAFGFGKKSGIEIQEHTGSLAGPDEQSELPYACIGHGKTTATPLQLANAFATLANGGTLYQPQLVAGKKPVIVSTLADSGIDAAHLRPVAQGLLDVVEAPEGTGRLAKVEGLRVAGKTGSGTLSDNRSVGLFAGYAPVESPRYAICVVQENKPGEASVPGGKVAAPVASRILAKAEMLSKSTK